MSIDYGVAYNRRKNGWNEAFQNIGVVNLGVLQLQTSYRLL